MKRSAYIEELLNKNVSAADASTAADLAERAGVEWDPESPITYGARDLAMRMYCAGADRDYAERAITNAVHPLVEALEAAYDALTILGRGTVGKQVRDAIHAWETGE